MRNLLLPLFSGSPGRQRLVWTILTVAVLALAGGGKKIVEAYEGLTSADRMTRISTFLSGAEDRSTPVTLIAVDDETRAKWGNPVITPHAAIARLIHIAREKAASAVLVDIDLSFDVPSQPPDPVLYNEIAHPPQTGPLLMLVRSIRFRGEQNGHPQRYIADSVRRTPYDRLIDGSKTVWVSAIPVFTGDRVVRKIKLWQIVCEGATGSIYPSPALYVAADAPSERRTALSDFLKAHVAAECGGAPMPQIIWPKRRSSEALLQFVIGADAADAAGKYTMYGRRRVPLFREVPAWTLLNISGDQIEPAGEVDGTPFEGRVVVIGVNHADSRDVYATPLGSQAGVMILANAVAGAHPMVDAPELSPFTESAVAVALFIVFAVIGSKLQIVVTTVVVGLMSGLLVMVMARQIGFDPTIRIIALALTLYALHHVIRAVVAIAVAWRGGLGWRALLIGKTGH
jgi:CHASE2 domain-containing sensor protein